ncbi:hypothetical protein P7C73_g3837, partial [Tremellales sp. Uapishka_1]
MPSVDSSLSATSSTRSQAMIAQDSRIRRAFFNDGNDDDDDDDDAETRPASLAKNVYSIHSNEVEVTEEVVISMSDSRRSALSDNPDISINNVHLHTHYHYHSSSPSSERSPALLTPQPSRASSSSPYRSRAASEFPLSFHRDYSPSSTSDSLHSLIPPPNSPWDAETDLRVSHYRSPVSGFSRPSGSRFQPSGDRVQGGRRWTLSERLRQFGMSDASLRVHTPCHSPALSLRSPRFPSLATSSAHLALRGNPSSPAGYRIGTLEEEQPANFPRFQSRSTRSRHPDSDSSDPFLSSYPSSNHNPHSLSDRYSHDLSRSGFRLNRDSLNSGLSDIDVSQLVDVQSEEVWQNYEHLLVRPRSHFKPRTEEETMIESEDGYRSPPPAYHSLAPTISSTQSSSPSSPLPAFGAGVHDPIDGDELFLPGPAEPSSPTLPVYEMEVAPSTAGLVELEGDTATPLASDTATLRFPNHRAPFRDLSMSWRSPLDQRDGTRTTRFASTFGDSLDSHDAESKSSRDREHYDSLNEHVQRTETTGAIQPSFSPGSSLWGFGPSWLSSRGTLIRDLKKDRHAPPLRSTLSRRYDSDSQTASPSAYSSEHTDPSQRSPTLLDLLSWRDQSAPLTTSATSPATNTAQSLATGLRSYLPSVPSWISRRLPWGTSAPATSVPPENTTAGALTTLPQNTFPPSPSLTTAPPATTDTATHPALVFALNVSHVNNEITLPSELASNVSFAVGTEVQNAGATWKTAEGTVRHITCSSIPLDKLWQSQRRNIDGDDAFSRLPGLTRDASMPDRFGQRSWAPGSTGLGSRLADYLSSYVPRTSRVW